MLDENLPTFRLKPSSDSPSTSVVFLTQHGSDPSPEYLFRRADPATQPASRNKYAAALCSAYAGADVVYAEVLIEPEWTKPSLSRSSALELGSRKDWVGISNSQLSLFVQLLESMRKATLWSGL